MRAKDLRDFVRSSPFRPFRMDLVDGKGLRVPHPDFALVTADYVVAANVLAGGVPGDINFVPYEHIARVEMLPRKAQRHRPGNA